MIKFKRIVAFLMCFVCALPLMNVTAYADEDYFSDEQKAYYKSLGLQGTTVNVYNWGGVECLEEPSAGRRLRLLF